MTWLDLALNILTAVGTFGATVISLWLSIRQLYSSIDSSFIWEDSCNYQPMIVVQNTSNRVSVIESIEIRYMGNKIYYEKILDSAYLSDFAIIEANEVKKILLPGLNFEISEPADKDKKYNLKIIIKQRKGRRSVSKTKYSYNEVSDHSFGQAFLND